MGFDKLVESMYGKMPTREDEQPEVESEEEPKLEEEKPEEAPEEEKPKVSALPKEGDKDVAVTTYTIRNCKMTMVSRDDDWTFAFYVDNKPVLSGEYGGAGAVGQPEISDGEAVANALILLMDENE